MKATMTIQQKSFKIANYTIDNEMKIHLCALVSPTQTYARL